MKHEPIGKLVRSADSLNSIGLGRTKVWSWRLCRDDRFPPESLQHPVCRELRNCDHCVGAPDRSLHEQSLAECSPPGKGPRDVEYGEIMHCRHGRTVKERRKIDVETVHQASRSWVSKTLDRPSNSRRD